MFKILPKINKKQLFIRKEANPSYQIKQILISHYKGEDLSKISTFKTELIQDIIYPPKWSIFSLNDFFMKSIKLTRELPLFAISAKLENNTHNLNETEKLYVKLLDLFETTPEKDESFVVELVMTFNDPFKNEIHISFNFPNLFFIYIRR